MIWIATKSLKFKRVYRHYLEWEEVRYNMWGTVPDRKVFLEYAIQFTGDHHLYGSYMQLVVQQWPVSCENALTDESLSKKAWLGHAACALAFCCPEDIVRLAWGKLTDEQQLLANKEAARAIQIWEDRYAKN
jgi:hypothetical protein